MYLLTKSFISKTHVRKKGCVEKSMHTVQRRRHFSQRLHKGRFQLWWQVGLVFYDGAMEGVVFMKITWLFLSLWI
jgi:hypothetical protein